MKRVLLLSMFMLLSGVRLHAQTQIQSLAADPPTCDPTRGLIYFNTTTQTFRSCVGLNVWGPGVSGNGMVNWARLGAVLGTPYSNGQQSMQEPSCWVQTSPQILSSGYSQVVACLYTAGGASINYMEAPTPQGPFTVSPNGAVIANSGCASNVLTLGGQLVVFVCSNSRQDIYRFHSTTHGISWVSDGAVILHNTEPWYSYEAANSSILVVGGTCYLWFEGAASVSLIGQGLYTGNATCDAGSFTENATDPAIPQSEFNGGGMYVFYDGANFWQWEHGNATVTSAYPTWVYFTKLNPTGIGTPAPHAHALVISPKGPDEGQSNTTAANVNAQVADPFALEWPYAQGDSRNTTYLYYSSCAANCIGPQVQEFTLKVAAIAMPMKTIVQIAQGDQGINANYLGTLFVNGIVSNEPLPVPTMFDNANRPNNANMGFDWGGVYGNSQGQIVSNQFTNNASGSRPLNLRVQPNADQFSMIQLVAAASTSNTGALVRGSPLQVTYYECVTVNALGTSQSLTLRKWVNNAGPTSIATATVTPQVGDWIMLKDVGQTLTCTLYDPAGNTTITGSDNSIFTGYVGFTATDATPATAIVDNWSGGSVYGPGSVATQQSQFWPAPQFFQTFNSGANCSSSAAPAACGTAAAGSVVIAAGGSTVTVDTTTVTANSQIFVMADDTLGTKLGVTCNSTGATLVAGLAVTARSAGISFQITSGATPAVNPLCVNYWIVN